MTLDPKNWAEAWDIYRNRGYDKFDMDDESYRFVRASLDLSVKGKYLSTEVFKLMSKLIAKEPLTEEEVSRLYDAQHSYSLASARALGEGILHVT